MGVNERLCIRCGNSQQLQLFQVSKHLLSSTIPFPISGTTLLPSISFLFFKTLLSLPGTCSLPALLLGFPAPPLAPPSFQHRLAKQDRMKGICSVLPNGGPLFGHGPTFGHVWPNRGPPFGLVWPNSAERKGGAEGRRGPVPESQRGAEREPMPRSWEGVEKARAGEWRKDARKEEEMGGRGAVPERERKRCRKGKRR